MYAQPLPKTPGVYFKNASRHHRCFFWPSNILNIANYILPKTARWPRHVLSALLLLLIVNILSTCQKSVWLMLNVSTYQKPHSTCSAIPNQPISKRISTWYLCPQTLTQSIHECSTCQSQLTCLKWHVRVWHVPNTATLLACALERLESKLPVNILFLFLLNNRYIYRI